VKGKSKGKALAARALQNLKRDGIKNPIASSRGIWVAGRKAAL
jgi:hypothetical protein